MLFIPIKTEEEVRELAQLAWDIWVPYFAPMLGRDTTEHIVRAVQSAEAIRQSLAGGYAYWFLAGADGQRMGYIGIQPQTHAGVLLLSKFYLVEAARGQGHAHTMLAFVEERAREHGLSRITLTVNPGNHAAINAYLQLGFHHAGTIHRDINGWEVDDVYMEKILV